MESTIKKILESFAADGFVFSNEQDFQFEMALALKKEPNVKSIKLETVSLTVPWSELKSKKKAPKSVKQYHDILVELTDGKVYLIELKYKTRQKLCFYETKQGQTVTFAQGAYDIGAYDFLEDVSRLENVRRRFMNNNMQEHIVKSYAVFLTNDKNYRFNTFSSFRKSKGSPWKNYSIANGQKFNKGLIPFNCKNIYSYKTPKGKQFYAITLHNDYKSFVWNDYPLEGYDNYEDKNGRSSCPGFSYLIVEVDAL